MGKQAIHTTQGSRAVVTFKASTDEYRVQFFDAAGNKVKGATYFTDDKADAIGTAELETARMLAAEAPQAAPHRADIKPENWQTLADTLSKVLPLLPAVISKSARAGRLTAGHVQAIEYAANYVMRRTYNG